jgi:hypothetical protein
MYELLIEYHTLQTLEKHISQIVYLLEVKRPA